MRLNVEDYKEQILKLYREGKSAKEISIILNFKYWQPVYNFFKKYNLIHHERKYNRMYTVDETFFDKIDTEEKAYIFGLICADGHVEKDRIVIALQEQDIDILEKIKSCIHSNQPLHKISKINPYTKTDRKVLYMWELQINCVKLVKALYKMGITHDKTYTLDSEIIKNVPKSLVRHFLRGYFDGDGNVFYGTKYNSGVKYNINICGNKDFLLSTYQEYFPSPNKLYKDKYSKQCYVWKLSSKQNVDNFLIYLYKDSKIYLDRKYKVFKNVVI